MLIEQGSQLNRPLYPALHERMSRSPLHKEERVSADRISRVTSSNSIPVLRGGKLMDIDIPAEEQKKENRKGWKIHILWGIPGLLITIIGWDAYFRWLEKDNDKILKQQSAG